VNDAQQRIDEAFRLVNRTVWIVTSAADGRRGGLVATWVSQASIDPERPVLAAAIAANHFTRQLIDESGALAAHLITARQIAHVWNFAVGSGRDREKLAGVPWQPGETGSPILTDCLALLEGRVFDRYDGGDRIYYWADVVAGERQSEGRPLTDQDVFEAATDDQRQSLRDSMIEDIAVQRPMYDQWRRELSRRRGNT
jgi:flavin reductase (DIM6/NTAB) family NADH-FMN oxidoreductase RutF